MSDNKSEKTDVNDGEEIMSPGKDKDSNRKMLEENDSPEKKSEMSPSKKKEDTPSKKRENKTEGADLMVADEKEYDKVSIADYVRLFKFSYGAWTMGAFFFQTLFCALI